MKEIIRTVSQTPIEIALGIDENGMTTARKLYAFLELRPRDFADGVSGILQRTSLQQKTRNIFESALMRKTPLVAVQHRITGFQLDLQRSFP